MLILVCGLQELQHQMENEAASARSERKKRENAERMCRQAVEDKVCCACEHSNTWVKGQKIASNNLLDKRYELCCM